MNLLEQTREFIENHKDIIPPKISKPSDVNDNWGLYGWTMTQSRLPWLKVQGITVPYKEMLLEAKNLRHRFINHRFNNGTGWYSLCIHGISSEQTDSASNYGYTDDTAPYQWTDISSLCPITTDFFKNNFHYDSYLRIRFMLLEPGGYIEPHHDSSDYRLGAINISLNNPKNCRLVNELGTVPHSNGSIILFNTSYQHAALNDSDEDRYHIIVHGMPNG